MWVRAATAAFVLALEAFVGRATDGPVVCCRRFGLLDLGKGSFDMGRGSADGLLG